ncbi:Dolichyl-diphosphooligosaccharide-protein glycosyltransferase 48kDa subunit, partial [Ramicandelaber brevisporus]
VSASGCRLLAVLSTYSAKDQQFSTVFRRLESTYDVTYKSATDPSLALFSSAATLGYGERQYDHLVLFAPKTRTFGGNVNAKSLVEFVNQGGNVVVVGGSEMGETVREFASQVGVEFDDRSTFVIDHFSYNEKMDAGLHTYVLSSNYAEDSPKQQALNSGAGGSLTPLTIPLLRANPTAYSGETTERQPVQGVPWVAGSDIALVSALQARNNARVVVSGSLELFSDAFIDAAIPSAANGQNVTTANAPFVNDVLSWTFQERGVLHAFDLQHEKMNDPSNSVDVEDEVMDEVKTYRVKDRVAVTVKISEFRNGEWHPFVSNDDVQLEVTMLDPYIITTLVPTGEVVRTDSKVAALYSTQSSKADDGGIKLPEKHGVFTLKVDYKRHGVSYFEVKDTIAARPFRHNEHPRYLSAAYPYYFSSASMLGGFILFTAVWLFNRAPDSPL